jgi:hypothetical protein
MRWEPDKTLRDSRQLLGILGASNNGVIHLTGLYREGKIVDPLPSPGLDFRPGSPRARRMLSLTEIRESVGWDDVGELTDI